MNFCIAVTPPNSCPTKIVTSGIGLPADIPDSDPSGVEVTLPVELEEGCGCIVDNVAITIGINHPNVGGLLMGLISPDNTQVLFLNRPGSYPDLVTGLEKFNNKNAAGDWKFVVFDFAAGDTGTLESVELTIECAE